jgi:hypothetical protein
MYDSPWVTFCYIFSAVSIVLYLGFTVVVTIGGIIDLVYMFKQLESSQVDETDDGRVVKSK